MGQLRMPLVPEGPIRVFFDRLHALHAAAGQPSMRELQRRTRSGRQPKGINPTTIHHAFVTPRLARWEVVREIVRPLGGDVDEFGALWRRARQAALQDADRRNVAADGLRPATPDESGAADRSPEEGAVPAVPRELPPDVSAFTGRADQLKQLDDLLPNDDDQNATAVVISAIAGMAGVGKTSLAVHWGHRVRRHFPDGQLYINLRGYAAGAPVPPVEALAQLLRSLGVPASQIPTDEPAAAGRYRSLLADRRVLVVLDNAASADQVRPLLPGSPGCLALVTSRDRLTGLVARDGARSLPLDVLSPDEARVLLSEIIHPDRVAAEPAAVSELAQACRYLPLALRVAAANLATQQEPSIAAQVAALHQDPSLSSLDVVGDEQTGVRRAFDLSYQALRPAAQRLFRLLGLVPGPDATVEAAAALADIEPGAAGALLDELAAVHLVNQPAPGRFASHDLLRRYAADRAGSDETVAARQAALRRLDGWYLHWADAAAAILYPHRLRLPVPAGPAPARTVLDDDASALAWLDAERANLVAAVRHAADHGRRPTAWLLADTLRGYFWLRMHTIDWMHTAEIALAAAEAEGDLGAQAPALLSLGDLHYRRNQYQQAAAYYTRAWQAGERTGWVGGQTAALGNLGVVHRDLGRLPQAADYLGQALVLCRASGSDYAQAVTLDCLGRTYWQMGLLAEAADCFVDALALNRTLGARQAEAACLGDLAEIQQAQGRSDEALDHVTRALILVRTIGDRSNEASLLRVLALVHRDAGRADEAAAVARDAVRLTRELADRQSEADSLNTLASILHRLGHHRTAAEHHEQALQLARATGDRYLEVEALIGLAAVRQQLGHHEPALDDSRRALTLARELGFGRLATRALAIHHGHSTASPTEPEPSSPT